MIKKYKSLQHYLLLWSTQSLSGLGSAMTNYALVLWLYQKSGSALKTAMLSVCSYAPYVLMSVFAGALSDRWGKKRTMLVCDFLAAMSTIIILVLLKIKLLQPWHMYLLNAVNGLMNTVQQPAGDVTATLLIPREYYQKICGLRSFSQSVTTILTPVIASALFAFFGMDLIIAVDLFTFLIAFFVLYFFIQIPDVSNMKDSNEKLFTSAKTRLKWLKDNPLILHLIFFLALINLIDSAFNASLPALILNRKNGGESVLGMVNALAGIATLVGSVFVTLFPPPKNRIRSICLALLLSMGTENFFLAFGRSPLVWYTGSVLGWISIPFMNANLDVILRTSIPSAMQGRVYACRNTLQFFSIPVGLFAGGLLVDNMFQPVMATVSSAGLLIPLFGNGKGSGAALMFCVLGIAGLLVCMVYRVILRKYTWNENVVLTQSDTDEES